VHAGFLLGWPTTLKRRHRAVFRHDHGSGGNFLGSASWRLHMTPESRPTHLAASRPRGVRAQAQSAKAPKRRRRTGKRSSFSAAAAPMRMPVVRCAMCTEYALASSLRPARAAGSEWLKVFG
jgi:hypothetical protein